MCIQVPCVYLLSAASTVIRNTKSLPASTLCTGFTIPFVPVVSLVALVLKSQEILFFSLLEVVPLGSLAILTYLVYRTYSTGFIGNLVILIHKLLILVLCSTNPNGSGDSMCMSLIPKILLV